MHNSVLHFYLNRPSSVVNHDNLFHQNVDHPNKAVRNASNVGLFVGLRTNDELSILAPGTKQAIFVHR